MQDNPEMFGLDLDEGFRQVRAMNRILEQLLVGLVPIRARAVDYVVIELDGQEWIIHRRILDQLAGTDSLPTRPLYVVGVAEQSLFWKDIRRVLFSGARFRVLCRIAQDTLQDFWTPVKLVHVLESVAPELANQINTAGSDLLAAMASSSKTDRRTELKQQLMHKALTAYATDLAAHYGHTLTMQDLSEVGRLSAQHSTSFGTLTEKREAFGAITSFLNDRFDLPRNSDITARYRAAALEDTGLLFRDQVTPLVASDDVPSPTSSQGRFLDTEFVAIYW
jgi:hypothetical protein